MKLSKLVHEGDVLIIQDPSSQDIFVVEVKVVKKSSIETCDVYPERRSSRDNLTDDYNWQLLTSADSLDTLRITHPEYFL